MSKSYSELRKAYKTAKDLLIDAMTKVVMEHGKDFHLFYDYYRNDFGIDEEETEENTKVLKIIDIFNNGGCCFTHANMRHDTTSTEGVESNIDWYSFAFWGLYVVEKNNKLYLKYYLLFNDGKEYDSDASEPDHDYAHTLTLDELEKLSEYLFAYMSQKGISH